MADIVGAVTRKPRRFERGKDSRREPFAPEQR